ncbi:PAS domain S-box protein [Christiangramia sp. SM2212]|uniref:histidine kinase n=1 Tax=Christiangramia sediminicola TaxID=3073267 RepID=A0ABU1EQB4_9FLAO|nr:PAS domain S-box protein [Christiangramia sp. SM2212]MDR5590556.1 PAS domain S-box protein [Christiangramia sp. SM2212]
MAYNQAAQEVIQDAFDLQLENGKCFSDFLPLNLRTEVKHRLRICRNGIKQFLVIDYSNTKLQFTFTPILSIDGKVNQSSISIEKSIQENLESSLKDSDLIKKEMEYNKQVYSNLFYNNPDAVFSFDLEGNFVNANAASAKLAETSINTLLNMHFLPLVTEADQEMVLNRFAKAVEGESQNYIINFLSLKGNKKILEINNFPITYEGKIIGIYGIAKDITKQKETENKIAEERQMLRAIIDNIPDYIFVKDQEHRSILANRKFYTQMLGESSDQSSEGYTPMDYFDSEKGFEIIEDNDRVMQTGVPVINRPDLVTNVDGKQEMVLLTKVPLKNKEDETIGLVGIARDITETYLHNKKQDLIFKIIKVFGDKPTFNEAMIQTLKVFCKDLGFDYAEAYKVSINNENLVRTAFWPPEKDLAELSSSGTTYLRGEGLPGKVWESGEVEILRQKEEADLFEKMILNNNESIKSAVGIPIIFQGKLISIFCLGSVSDAKKIETDVLGDITLQIASAIERKRSQDQLNDFFQFSPNLIAVIGMDGFVKKINPSFVQKFGFSESEILSKPFTEFLHPDDLDKTYKAIEDISIQGSDFELRCLKKDGDYLWISWRFSRYFIEENVVFIYGTDITPLKKVHEELSGHIAERKKVQKKLEESEKKYRSLFDASPLPMWVLDRDELKFLKVNKAAIELYGFTEEEFSRMSVRDLWAPKQEDRIEKVIAKNTDSFFQVKVEHIKKNGDRIFVNVNSNPMVFAGQNARVSLVRDVTARIKAEEQLLHSEKRFKSLVQEGSDLISIVDKSFNYIYNSPATKTVFGLKPSEMNGTDFKDYINKDDYKNIAPHLNKLDSSKRVQLPSYRVRNAKGKWSWIETIITNLNNDPSIQGIVMNSRDITEFVEQERELIDSLRRYDIVAKATSDLITDYDIEKDEMRVSDVATELFGYSNDDGVYSGDWWNNKIHPDDIENVRCLAKQMRVEGLKNLTTEYRFQCLDGSYKYILDRSYLITDEDDNPKRIIGSMQDITERKQHLIAIENHNQRLKEIAWTQSHVVRAPLAKVMGLVDLLLNYKNDLENVNEILDNILTSAQELDVIIRQIAIQTEKEL